MYVCVTSAAEATWQPIFSCSAENSDFDSKVPIMFISQRVLTPLPLKKQSGAANWRDASIQIRCHSVMLVKTFCLCVCLWLTLNNAAALMWRPSGRALTSSDQFPQNCSVIVVQHISTYIISDNTRSCRRWGTVLIKVQHPLRRYRFRKRRPGVWPSGRLDTCGCRCVCVSLSQTVSFPTS